MFFFAYEKSTIWIVAAIPLLHHAYLIYDYCSTGMKRKVFKIFCKWWFPHHKAILLLSIYLIKSPQLEEVFLCVTIWIVYWESEGRCVWKFAKLMWFYRSQWYNFDMYHERNFTSKSEFKWMDLHWHCSCSSLFLTVAWIGPQNKILVNHLWNNVLILLLLFLEVSKRRRFGVICSVLKIPFPFSSVT